MSVISVGAVPENIYLSNAVWRIDIITRSLAVEARPAGPEIVVPISSEQTGFGNITEFSQDDNTVSWRLPERSLTVRFDVIYL